MTSEKPNHSAKPDFVVIGAMRAGTTTLYELMRASGRVCVPGMKETDYFMTDRQYNRGQDWFLRQFANHDVPLCDFSANYSCRGTFAHPARRIYETNPDAKIIYIVRDPVKRAVSQYAHMSAAGFDMPKPGELSSHKEGRTIVDASKYAHQLDAYLEYWSLDDIFIVDFDDLISDQTGSLQRLYAELGVSERDELVSVEAVKANSSTELQNIPAFWSKFRRSKIGETVRPWVPRALLNAIKSAVAVLSPSRTIGALSKEDKEYVREQVRADTQRFREITGRDFENWSV